MARALLVGAGAMGRAWAKMLKGHDEVHIAAWVDIRRDAAAQAAEELELSDTQIGDDVNKALAEGQFDFVVDVTPPEAHHRITLAALAAGVPVLGEKPMADSMSHAREMVAASERAGKLYMVSQNRRYNTRLVALRRLIAEQIGPLGILTADFFISPHFLSFREQMSSPLLLDMAIHTFDAARYLSGADAISVYCEEYNPSWSWFRGSSSANALFEMAGDLRFIYRGSWCSQGRHTSWDAEWRAVGPRGSATWDGNSTPVAEVVIGTGGFFADFERREGVIEPAPESIAGSLRDFLHALKTGATPMGECHDNIKSLAMVFAAIESAAVGRRVPVVP